MSDIIRGTVVEFRDNGNATTTVTYEYNPPIGRHGMQNVTVNSSDITADLTCGATIGVNYQTEPPTIISLEAS